MTPILRNLLIGIAVILLLFELGFRLHQSNKESEKTNPIDKEGKIKVGHTVPVEKEKNMAINSFPIVKDQEFNDNFMYALIQSLLYPAQTGKEENKLTFIGTNIGNSEHFTEINESSKVEKGKFILNLLTQGKSVTNVQCIPNGVEDGNSNESVHYLYDVTISLNHDTEVKEFEFEITDRKITRITEISF